jgi:heptose I phosphotransferase
VDEPATWLRDDVAQLFEGDPVERAWSMKGEVVRAVAGRETLRVDQGCGPFFLKRHRGVGWREIFKNWLVLKRPVIGARNEFEACRHLQRAGVRAPIVAAFGESDGSLAARSSFVMCDALGGFEDLERITERWLDEPPDPLSSRRLIHQVASFVRRLHAAGVVHRDLYLCHLLVNPDSGEMAVLDLHRALIFDELPERWRERDLAALLFSSLDLPVSRLSWLRFVRLYTNKPLNRVFEEEGTFWQRVYDRAVALYDKGTAKGLTQGTFTSAPARRGTR